jgi:AraC-like DNA-binding protein
MHDCPMVPVQNGFYNFFIHLNSSRVWISYNDNTCIFLDGLSGLFDLESRILIKPQITEETIEWVVITFTYSGLGRLLSIEGKEIFNRIVKLSDLFGNSAGLLQEQLYHASNDFNRKMILDCFFKKRLRKISYYKERKLIILDNIFKETCGLVTIESLSQKLSMSYRSVERLFERDVGLNFRSCIRIHRINRVMKQLRKSADVDFLDIIFGLGYYDQAHFIRDFKKFTGYLPQKFMKLTHGDYFLNMPYVIKEDSDMKDV